MAQIERAILLARAIATSMRGLRPSIRCSQVPSRAPFRQAQRTMTIAPVINSRRISRCPILEIFPRTCLPPVECCTGTRPSQAAKSRPRRNTSIGGAKVSSSQLQSVTSASQQSLKSLYEGQDEALFVAEVPSPRTACLAPRLETDMDRLDVMRLFVRI